MPHEIPDPRWFSPYPPLVEGLRLTAHRQGGGREDVHQHGLSTEDKTLDGGTTPREIADGVTEDEMRTRSVGVFRVILS